MKPNSPTPEVLDLEQFKGFTPGPWKVYVPGDSLLDPTFYGIDSEGDHPFSVILQSFEDEDHQDKGGVRGATPEEARANAYLIAAAPELLSRLQAAESQLALVTRERQEARDTAEAWKLQARDYEDALMEIGAMIDSHISFDDECEPKELVESVRKWSDKFTELQEALEAIRDQKQLEWLSDHGVSVSRVEQTPKQVACAALTPKEDSNGG